MAVKIGPEDLSEEIGKQLEAYSSALNKKLNEKLEEVAKDTAKKLQGGGPYRERTGRYTKDWTYKTTGKSASGVSTDEYTVYNKKNYQLTHLLEKGHVSRSGSRVRAFEHIAPAEQMAILKASEAVREAGI